MRVGLVRNDVGLPDLRRQTDLLRSTGRCSQVVEVGPGLSGAKRLENVLLSLGPGDVACVVDLAVFNRSLDELARLLRDLAEAGVLVSIVSASEGEALIEPAAPVVRVLQLLAACEPKQPPHFDPQLAWYRRPYLPADEFTSHQRDHVHRLHADGHSLRAIGLIFRTSPVEVLKVLSQGRRPSKARAAGKNA